MFRIRKNDTVTKTFRMPTDMLKELEKHAQRHNISVNKLVIQCCKYALDNLDPEDASELIKDMDDESVDQANDEFEEEKMKEEEEE